MFTSSSPSTPAESSLWITSLVNGLAGLTVKVRRAVHFEASPFQKIEVFDTYAFGRVLMLGGAIVLTERDEHIYNEMLTHVTLLHHPAPRRVCVIGGGDGGVAREALKHPGVEEVVVVEIDAMVVDAVKAHFTDLGAAFDDSRCRLVIADGCSWLESAADRFDVIIVDAYDPGGPVQSLSTPPFYETVSRTLEPHGIAAFQTDSPGVAPATLRAACTQTVVHFGSSRVFLVPLPSFPEGICSFVLCQHEGEGGGIDAKRCAAIAQECRYFSPEVLEGAFKLPASVARLIV